MAQTYPLAGTVQTLVDGLYPPRCLGCGDRVDSAFGLCAACWGDTPFLGGHQCDLCGAAMAGSDDPDFKSTCDDCLRTKRPWVQGRSVLQYKGKARDLILSLKHSDRADIAGPAGRWMANAARDLYHPDMIVVPVPLHWMRLIKRRYNQAALLAQSLAATLDVPVAPDLLIRTRRTRSLKGKTAEDRAAELKGAITVAPRRRHLLIRRPVLIVDDVMTTGATLSACVVACQAAGSGPVRVITLARVGKDT